ncbi:hypothetical protein ACFCX4_13665 [Kitasatospora sp. NPDC056327]|uniref:hypothetical protein n=1 Tax=Kitasatospora sp. NPDC056327 TaxID=3345785 RepID=UPI0035DC2B62
MAAEDVNPLWYLLAAPQQAFEAVRRRFPVPSDRALRAHAVSFEADAARAREIGRIDGLVERLGGVPGVTHVLTRLSDRCFRTDHSHATGIRAWHMVGQVTGSAYFSTPLEVPELLRRIRDAEVAGWGTGLAGDPRLPEQPGTVAAALAHYRDGGLRADGTERPPPRIAMSGTTLDWDLPGSPLPDPPPLPADGGLYSWRRDDPDAVEKVLAARARHGLVLRLEFGGHWNPDIRYYYGVRRRPRRGGRWRRRTEVVRGPDA